MKRFKIKFTGYKYWSSDIVDSITLIVPELGSCFIKYKKVFSHHNSNKEIELSGEQIIKLSSIKYLEIDIKSSDLIIRVKNI